MTVTPRPFPRALPHGELREVLSDIYFVQGTIKLPMALPMRFSRNMTVVREGERLVVVNSVRLDEAGLAALDKLGKVTDVIRIAGNHGMDDPFYADRYGAKVWVVKGQRYTAGFDTTSPKTYFEPHGELAAGDALPLAGAQLYVIASTPPEGILVLPQHGGVAIVGDALQNMATVDPYFNFLGGFMMKRMGFIKPLNVGPAWFSRCKPPLAEVRGMLGLTAANVLPAHGEPVLGDAIGKYRPAIDRVAPPA